MALSKRKDTDKIQGIYLQASLDRRLCKLNFITLVLHRVALKGTCSIWEGHRVWKEGRHYHLEIRNGIDDQSRYRKNFDLFSGF